MTIQKPIGAHEDAAAWNACLRALGAALDASERFPDGRRMLGEALCAVLETVSTGGPRLDTFGNLRDDARFWADVATPMELEAYAAAALQAMRRVQFAPSARKRLFAMLWNTFTDQEREAFLAKIEQKTGD
ncbi:MAG: hypothetical protein EP341_00715 [Sphingomonadales bacterium]|nr:MAG: hypothetical protein EP341_00715 [Sphingomonadales bacterium]